ncbi:MAG: thiamine phosphate synthase [Hahellaceae bacterium]|nr:thiamine phosphate synthase [Hahellaceae bacterium]MCP5168512.1 thiamine phosphate synthase [Hahellaceae bacterium]
MNNLLTGLYAITAPELSQNHLVNHVEAALKGGARVIQYRDKISSEVDRLKTAKNLFDLCRDYDRPLIINDDIRLCQRVGAHGVHLGRADGDITLARQLLGPAAIIGATCHASLDFARESLQAGANYLAFGRFFDSKSKPDAPAAPLSLLTQAKSQFSIPIVAIGGITLDNAQSTLAAGASMIAVIHSLFAVTDLSDSRTITARAQAFSKLSDILTTEDE